MARPRKQTVDYFPHFCTHGKTIYILEQKYGNDGYAFWFKLLEMLGGSEGHYLDLKNQANLEFLAAKTHMEADKCKEILNLLSTLEAIDKELWEKSIVWSDNFLENVKDAYRNRTIEIPSRPSFLRKKPEKTQENDDNQRKKTTDEMKEDEMKENNIYKGIFDYWISLGIINHQKLNDKMRNKIKAKLNQGYTSEYIKQTMKNYSDILNSDLHYFSHKWSLDNFLQRGFEQFEDREAAWQNFIDKKKNVNEKRQKDQETINYFLKGDKGNETERHS